MNGREKALERYLNSACAGLYGLEWQTVRDELEANLLERVREFQVMGFAREVALEKALEEFGAPSRVSRGMREVYVMPKMMKGGALAGLLAIGAYLALSSSVALPLSLTYDGPCKENCVWMGMSYVSVSSLERELKAQGVQVARDPKTLSATFPNGAKSRINIQLGGDGGSETAIFRRGQEVYIPTYALLRLAHAARTPAYISSVLNPTLSIGKVRLSLENPGAPTGFSSQLSSLVAEWLCNNSNKAYGRNPANAPISVCPVIGVSRPDASAPVHRLALGKPGKMYALLLPQTLNLIMTKLHVKQNTHRLMVLEADANGILTFSDTPSWEILRTSSLNFATSAREFANGKSKKALLLELTGRLDFGGQNYKLVSKIPPLERLK